MGNTVYAENMGYFHKGSGGKGIAPGDVCLTPPPPPTGPIPVPYVNMLSAGDLAKGSKTVKIEGNPTALENASYISTSTGNEPATQGGGVVTHKTKGKGSFKLWSFTVKAEGKGVCRHGDPMEQNTASPMPNCIDASALESFKVMLGDNFGKPCTKAYKRSDHAPAITDDQYEACLGGPCWECAKDPDTDPGVWDTLIDSVEGEGDERISVMVDRDRSKTHYKSKDGKEAFTPDHQPPLVVAWYMGGCHLKDSAFKDEMKTKERVNPHCRKHAQSQGSRAKAFASSEY
ncbi:DUF4150 domain-containing protein (plasmid) [Sulfitobacter sp. S223]|uniref:DUF4150 domain-containing protein n=1 Tax=Sulfitobacter sp. S223 TaxID=2867023 RepID=UPI0021A3C5F6|nr:DUF4150 domain-containing protein [Sulfitobacter sp. S223]UWR28254.1 DUF4150 domain-containing protein [Sulfitobacter sp. S223]